MRNWIYRITSGLPSILTAPIRGVADRIYGVFNDGVQFAKWIKGGVSYLRDRAKYFATELGDLIGDAYDTIYWIIRVFIPLYVAGLVNDGIRYIQRRIDVARNALLSLINDIASGLIRRIDLLTRDVRSRINDVVNKLREIIASFVRVQLIVFTLLTDPRRMADWLIGAMVSKMWSYVYRQRDNIVRSLLRDSPALTSIIARELSRIIRRIL